MTHLTFKIFPSLLMNEVRVTHLKLIHKQTVTLLTSWGDAVATNAAPLHYSCSVHT